MNTMNLLSKKILCLLACLSLVPSLTYADNHELSLVAALANSLNRADKSAIWPEFKINSSPIIIYFSNNHHYAYNFFPTNPDWKIQNDSSRTLYYLDHDAYGIDDLPWGNSMIDGQSSFIFNVDGIPDPSNNIILHVLLHERFHVFQFKNFPTDIYNFDTYNGFNNLENVKLTYIEDLALSDYLTTSSVQALKDFVAINQYRQKMIGTDSAQYEMKKENIEGIADYYGWSMAIPNETERNRTIISTYKNTCDMNHLIKCQIHNRYYFTGNSIAIALDQLTPEIWKEKLVKNKLSIRDQLNQYFAMTDSQIQKRVREAKIYYHYEDITKPIEQAIKNYKDKRDSEFNHYTNSTGVIFNLERIPCDAYSMISSKDIYYMDSNTQLILDNNGITSCSDESIKINFIKTPYTLQKEHSGEEQVKINPDTKIEYDGKSIYLSELAKVNMSIDFDNLHLQDPALEVTIKNRHGQLKSNDGVVYLITDTHTVT